jgi:hypothetical protein
METVAIADDAPWIHNALSQLHKLEVSGKEYRGVADLRISHDTSQTVKQLLTSLAVGNFPTPSVDVFSGAGVSLRWQVLSREVKFSVFPDQTIVFEQYQDDELVNDGVLSDTSSGTPRLMWLIQP